MRSEERAGIISSVMLFLWGTLIAEPFHIFARYIASGVNYALKGFGTPDIVISLVLYLIVIAVIVLLQKLATTKISTYMPCGITVLCIGILVFKSIARSTVDFKDGIALAIPAALCVLFYLIRFDKGLTWFTDVYIYALGIALVNSLLFVPIAKLNDTVSNVLYISRYNSFNITDSFAGLAGIHEIIWGFFLTAFAVLPIIYLATAGRRK